ncbi:serine hydrolase [Sphingomonas sp. DBB INV C78]|uniref:serine hydrolase n=1 Tax=Sphingomonas sp. DBB INV C78 TaxID=3349434 RepID=UPI0036D27517
MKSRIMLAALPIVALTMPMAHAEVPRDFEARVEQLRQQTGTPGIAIAIVEDGKVVHAKGYGVRKQGAPEKVDADTIFMIGSTGKAFTAAALATLVDAGKLKWDDKVVDHLPDFQMYDPWVTREMTVRDLLVHRSGLGLGAGDLLVIPRGNRSREEVVRRLRYLKPATSFRSGYAYDNILYVVAGRLTEVVSGQSWEDYMREHVFTPAGLAHAAADDQHRFGNPNRAQPHGRVGGPVRGDGPQKLLDERDQLARASAPAGLLAMSANDMARWLQIQLANGATPEGGRLFSKEASREMWAPVTPMPLATPPAPIQGTAPQFQAYALGWEVRDYRGTKILWHAGGLFGFTSVVVLIPEKNVGFAIELNAEEIEPRFGLMYELLDHYLGLPKQDWPAKFGAYRRARIADAQVAIRQKAASPAAVGPSLSLDRYAGRFSDPWYGELIIGKDGKDLTVDFTPTPGMKGHLEHWQYDSFIARFDDPAIEAAYLIFALDADGKVAQITMKPVSPIADFSFDYQDLRFTPQSP